MPSTTYFQNEKEFTLSVGSHPWKKIRKWIDKTPDILFWEKLVKWSAKSEGKRSRSILDAEEELDHV